MRITFDPRKRQETLAARGLDFADVAEVFAGPTLEVVDTRKDYGELRIISFGYFRGRLIVIGYTPRGTGRHIFSMRKANGREEARIASQIEV